jgi:hypothetical protein
MAYPPKPLELEEFLTIDHAGSDEHVLQVMRDYFHVFAGRTKDPENENQEVCCACGEKFTGLMANLGLGVGIEWGLAHGEGHCSYCHWPYRGHHFVYDPADKDEEGRKKEGTEPLMTIHNFFLAYMPENVGGWTRPPPMRGL